MAFDDACHVRHAAVTEFDVKFVAKFVEAVVWGEGLVDEIEELLPILVLTSMSYGELNQVMFLFLVLCFLRFGGVVGCMGYAVQGECPAFLKASA